MIETSGRFVPLNQQSTISNSSVQFQRTSFALFLDSLQPVRAGHAGARSARLPPPRPRRWLSRGPGLERPVDWPRRRFRRDDLFLARPQAALEFVTGYVLELSLSVDNLFVFLLIFRYFTVPEEHQHSVLFWGILGALVMRGFFILAGVGLIHRFHWILYGLRRVADLQRHPAGTAGEHQIDPAKNPVVKALRRLIPGHRRLSGRPFLCPRAGEGTRDFMLRPCWWCWR